MNRVFLLILFVFIGFSNVYGQSNKEEPRLKIARDIAWIADDEVKGEIKGVIIEFHGLGSPDVRGAFNMNDEEKIFAQNGYLVVFPYYGPWSWMNRQAREMLDYLVDVIYTELNIKSDAPLILYGGSMGGFSALLYSRYAEHPVAAVVANCPVTNIKYHFYEREDLPRTFRCAYWGYDEPFDDVMTEHNPIDQVANMPNIPYFIMHTTGDDAVSKVHHSDVFVKAMKKTRHDKVIYKEIQGGHHCGPIPDDIEKEKLSFILGFLK